MCDKTRKTKLFQKIKDKIQFYIYQKKKTTTTTTKLRQKVKNQTHIYSKQKMQTYVLSFTTNPAIWLTRVKASFHVCIFSLSSLESSSCLAKAKAKVPFSCLTLEGST